MPPKELAPGSPPIRDGVDADGGVALAAHRLPFSSFASKEARDAFLERVSAAPRGADIAALRDFYGLFNDALASEMKAKYSVIISEETMGGVPVQRVAPRGTPEGGQRLLINLHGGAFMWGAGSGALVEAIPIAAVANTTVVTVDYRLAPEHKFPAASEDVCAVYEAALRERPANRIGVYGCSAGAILTAQTVALLASRNLPVPGAVAMLCGAGGEFSGDSSHLAGSLIGAPAEAGPTSLFELAYMREARRNDPLAVPECSDPVLSAFPPSLLITASRDFAASSVTQFHRRLAANGVDAQLFVFDGLWHAFHIFCGLPESEETYRLVARFFDRKLGSINAHHKLTR